MLGSEQRFHRAVCTPRWMWGWTAAPPLRATDIWAKLSDQLRKRVDGQSWIFPLYRRLAMGSSHSVHIPMSINIHTVGKTLWSFTRLGSFKEALPEPVDKIASAVPVDVLAAQTANGLPAGFQAPNEERSFSSDSGPAEDESGEELSERDDEL